MKKSIQNECVFKHKHTYLRELSILHYAYCPFSAMLESNILELLVNCTYIKDSEHKKG